MKLRKEAQINSRVKTKLKGWFGEKKVAFNLWCSLSKKDYQRFHNIILPSTNGTAQIDHLIISTYGLFIIETKNRKGWILGSKDQSKWAQVIFKQKHTFQNPLHQAYRQKKVLKEFLNIEENVTRTVVYFVGDCTFKTSMPNNVIKSGLGNYIKKFPKTALSSKEVSRLVNVLDHHKSQSKLRNRHHINSLKIRHNSEQICPKCGGELVIRTAKAGRAPGTKFLGCKNYPKCRFTKKIRCN